MKGVRTECEEGEPRPASRSPRRVRRAKIGGEAGIRTLGRALKTLQRFSKPPPSASRPPHRASASIRDTGTYAEVLNDQSAGRTAVKPSPLPLSATTRVGCIVRATVASGTIDWAQFRAHSARFLLSPFKNGIKTRGGGGFLDRRLRLDLRTLGRPADHELTARCDGIRFRTAWRQPTLQSNGFASIRTREPTEWNRSMCSMRSTTRPKKALHGTICSVRTSDNPPCSWIRTRAMLSVRLNLGR